MSAYNKDIASSSPIFMSSIYSFVLEDIAIISIAMIYTVAAGYPVLHPFLVENPLFRARLDNVVKCLNPPCGGGVKIKTL